MNKRQLDMLKAALLEVGMKEVQYVRSLPVPSQPRSAKFEQNIKQIFQNARHDSSSRTMRIPRKKWLTILIAAILILSLSLSVSAIQKPVFSIFERITDRFTEIFFSNRQETSPLQEYQVDWVPDHYELSNDSVDLDLVSFTWVYGDQFISFTQYSDGYHIYFDTENVPISCVLWADREITYYPKYNTYHFSWSENGYFFTLVCPTDLPLSDIQRMIESIHPVETAPS